MDCEKIISELSNNYKLHLIAGSFLEELDDSALSCRDGKTNNAKINVCLFLRKEIHSLLCTKSVKYKKERSLLSSTAAPAIAVLSAALTTKFGIATGTSGTLAAIFLTIPLKISINTWCNIYNQNMDGISQEEEAEIKSIRDKQ